MLMAFAGGVCLFTTSLAAGQDLSGNSAGTGSSSAVVPPVANWKFLHDRTYFEPLSAERAARTALLIPAWSSEFPHSEKGGSRFAWQVVLGQELPIFVISSQVSEQPLDRGQWGAGVWIPISFHMIEDFEDESNPIVDTDYRFGFMLKAQYRPWERVRLGLRYVPWAHESTHLGDEYTIIASRRREFERINVSYEYQSYGISVEVSELFAGGDDALILRHGGILPWGEDGYYSNHLLGSELPTLTPSQANFEPSLGIEYHLPELIGRNFFMSFDVRHKLAYNYHQTDAAPERKHWTWTLQVGQRVSANTSGVPLRRFLSSCTEVLIHTANFVHKLVFGPSDWVGRLAADEGPVCQQAIIPHASR